MCVGRNFNSDCLLLTVSLQIKVTLIYKKNANLI